MRDIVYRWWRDLARRVFVRRHYRRVTLIDSCQDGGQLRRDEVALVGGAAHPKWALLLCPCGCGDVIHVNLMKTHHPHWSMDRERDGTVSFSPSLWVDGSRCGSHFLLIRGRVIWCRSNETTDRLK